MKLKLGREDLLRPLQQVIGAVERRQTLPALAHVLLRSDASETTLTATDLEIELVARIAHEPVEPGETTLPARKLLDIVKALPEGSDVDLGIEGERALLKAGRSRFTLATLPAADFPSLEDFKGSVGFEVPQGRLKDLIDRTAFAMAQQDVRYYLNGLLLELAANGLRTVATDGHRLAVCETTEVSGAVEAKQVIVPRKGVLELGRLLADGDEALGVQLSGNHVRVELPGVRFTSKLIDGRFPDYQRVMPQGSDKTLVAERDALREALSRTAILSNEKYRGIRLSLESDSLRIQANNPDQEEAQEELPVEYDGDPLEVGFNVNYLIDVLNVLDGPEVRLNLRDANSSCLITGVDGGHCQYVVMPMRL